MTTATRQSVQTTDTVYGGLFLRASQRIQVLVIIPPEHQELCKARVVAVALSGRKQKRGINSSATVSKLKGTLFCLVAHGAARGLRHCPASQEPPVGRFQVCRPV